MELNWWETLFSSKSARILQMLMTITSWTTGLDKRLAAMEARLGAIEIGLQAKGIPIPHVGTGMEAPPETKL